MTQISYSLLQYTTSLVMSLNYVNWKQLIELRKGY